MDVTFPDVALRALQQGSFSWGSCKRLRWRTVLGGMITGLSSCRIAAMDREENALVLVYMEERLLL